MATDKLLVLCLCLLAARAAKLRTEFTWTYISYAMVENSSLCDQAAIPDDDSVAFPDDAGPPGGRGGYFKSFTRADSVPVSESHLPRLENDEYVAENNIPMGTTRYGHRIFVTVPRRRVGIPGTLNYISLNCKARHNVPLMPYPSWEMNSLTAPRPADPTDVTTPLVSVYRTSVDHCDRLWLVDMGILEYPTGRQQVQQFAIVVIDLRTDRVIRRHPISVEQTTARSTLADITVDVTSSTCGDAYAYIPDLVNYRLIVYSWRDGISWVVNHNNFYVMPRGGEFAIGGFNFQWNDGVFSVALSKARPDGHRTAYFHAMASTEEFSVCTCVLRNRTAATRGYHGNDFKFVGDRGSGGQSSTHALHTSSGIMFFGLPNQYGLGCWDTGRPFSAASYDLVHTDQQRMIYPGDVRVDFENNVWMMTNSMPVFLYGRLDYSKTNFRIWTGNVKEIVKGTKCDPRRH